MNCTIRNSVRLQSNGLPKRRYRGRLWRVRARDDVHADDTGRSKLSL